MINWTICLCGLYLTKLYLKNNAVMYMGPHLWTLLSLIMYYWLCVKQDRSGALFGPLSILQKLKDSGMQAVGTLSDIIASVPNAG